MTGDTPSGRRFSHVYLERGDPLKDGVRFRRRVYRLFDEIRPNWDAAAKLLQYELGVDIPSAPYGYDFAAFFETCELRDVLDAVTLIGRYLAKDIPARAGQWHSEIARIMVEEHVGYTLDKDFGVHLLVDLEFEHNKLATVSTLGAARYSAVLKEFERGYGELDTEPPNFKGAIRGVFEAAEILFKLVCPRAPRIGTAEIKEHLKPIIDRMYREDVVALRVASQLTANLCSWVDANHHYRHGQKSEEPQQPPADIAIWSISTGAAHIRWLASVDQWHRSSATTKP